MLSSTARRKSLIEILVLPDRVKHKINTDKIKVKELVERIKGDLESLAILVNGKLVEDPDSTIEKRDKVVVIRQATGGI
ncbi:MAG: hypothetical protein DRO13_04235 [Thermoprotei archaeon]|nr:MAG: hypothetical protein DRO13_04235 [Thermoprotei archaeon]